MEGKLAPLQHSMFSGYWAKWASKPQVFKDNAKVKKYDEILFGHFKNKQELNFDPRKPVFIFGEYSEHRKKPVATLVLNLPDGLTGHELYKKLNGKPKDSDWDDSPRKGQDEDYDWDDEPKKGNSNNGFNSNNQPKKGNSNNDFNSHYQPKKGNSGDSNPHNQPKKESSGGFDLADALKKNKFHKNPKQ